MQGTKIVGIVPERPVSPLKAISARVPGEDTWLEVLVGRNAEELLKPGEGEGKAGSVADGGSTVVPGERGQLKASRPIWG